MLLKNVGNRPSHFRRYVQPIFHQPSTDFFHRSHRGLLGSGCEKRTRTILQLPRALEATMMNRYVLFSRSSGIEYIALCFNLSAMCPLTSILREAFQDGPDFLPYSTGESNPRAPKQRRPFVDVALQFAWHRPLTGCRLWCSLAFRFGMIRASKRRMNVSVLGSNAQPSFQLST